MGGRKQLYFIGHFVRLFNKEYERVMLLFLEENPEARLLDLGCRDGQFTMKMANKIGTRYVYGVDLSEEELEKAGDNGVGGIVGDLDKRFPIGDEAFDVVCASQIIEHLSNTDGFLKEIYRVLKPGGYLVISTPNLASYHNVAYLLMGRQPPVAMVSDEMGEGWGRKNHNAGPAHRRLFTFPSFAKLLKYHGFKVERIVGSCYYPFPASLARFMCLLDKGHSACINIKARKESKCLV